MGRTLLTFAAITMLVFLLGACGGSNEADKTEEGGAEGTELTFWTFAGTHADFFENAAERWNQENPEKQINLKVETYPFDQMHNNLLMALQSGEGAPDIVDIEIAKFSNFLKGEVQLVPLNDIIEPEIDSFIPERLRIYEKDGNYYGAPTHLGATVVYYNKEIMDEAGVDIDSIATWDDYVEAGKKVVETTGKPMTTVAINWYSIWPFIVQKGSDFFDENGNLTLDNDTNIDTLSFINDWVNKYGIAEVAPGGNYHNEEFYGFMNNGGQASLIIPLFYMKDFTEYMPDLKGKMEIRLMPAWEDSDNVSAPMGGTGTAITNQSESVELAKEFLYFSKLSKDGNIRLWTELGFDPYRWDALEDPIMEEDNEYYEYFHDGIFDILLEAENRIGSVNITEFTPDVLSEIESNVMHNVIRENAQDPEEALKQTADNVKEIMGQ